MNWQRIGAAALLWFSVAAAHAADVLPSWRDGPARQALIAFVGEVTDPAGKKFVPAPERIAVFDNDGTLWAEQPMYFQVLFAFDRLRAMAPAHPEWQANPLFKAVIDNDAAAIAAAGEKGLVDIVMATHAGAHADFMAAAKAWLAQARHPLWQRPFVSLTYQPMRELLGWLRTHGFKTFIVTGGDTEFVRAFAEREYGVPPEQVIAQQAAAFAGIAVLKEECEVIFGGDPAAFTPVDADPAVAAFVPPTLLYCAAGLAAQKVHDTEVFGPVATLIPYTDTMDAIAIAPPGKGLLVASVYSADSAFLGELVPAIGDLHGRILVVNGSIGNQHTGHGNVMPTCLHGGPGRAGGGEELGGLRALLMYHRRFVVQAIRPCWRSCRSMPPTPPC